MLLTTKVTPLLLFFFYEIKHDFEKHYDDACFGTLYSLSG